MISGCPVREVRTCLVPLPLADPVTTPNYRITDIWHVLVEVRDEDGERGASYLWCFSRQEAVLLQEAVRMLVPVISGSDPGQLEATWLAMRRLVNFLGFKGITVFAMSAIDMALVDLDCRQRGVALSRRYTGTDPAPAPAYWSGLFLHTPVPGLLDEVDQALDRGLRAVKLRVGAPVLADDVARVEAVRHHLPDDVVLMLDAVQRWQAPEAITAAKAFAPYEPRWLEDPLVHDDYEGLAEVTARSPVPIATGENEYLLGGFEQLFAAGVHVLLADLQRVGGITEWRRLAARAAAAGLPLTSHTYPHVAAHLCAAMPAGVETWVEYVPWWDSLVSTPVVFRDGRLVPSDNPGIGIEWHPEALARAATGWQTA